MRNDLGEIIERARKEQSLTQDQYGAKYSVSGPAIFKFEKGYVRPSLKLWLSMAVDAGVPQARAVLLWVRSKLPEEFQGLIDIQAGMSAEPSKKGAVDYATCANRDAVKTMLATDKAMPKSLRELLEDDELWALFKPTGTEITYLRDVFGKIGRGNKAAYRDALHAIRSFTKKQ